MTEAISFVLGIAAFVGAIALIGAAWNYLHWLKDGRPNFTQQEQLRIDLLRSQGRTLTGARREVQRSRQSGPVKAMQEIADTEDLLFNPSREDELAAVMPAVSEGILALPNDDPTKQAFIEQMLEADESEMGEKMLAAMRDSNKREKVTAAFSQLIVSANKNSSL